MFVDGHGGTWRHGSCQRRLRAGLGETPLIEMQFDRRLRRRCRSRLFGLRRLLLPQPATRATRQMRLTGNRMQYAALRMRLTPVPPPAHPSVLHRFGSAPPVPHSGRYRLRRIGAVLPDTRHVPALDDFQACRLRIGTRPLAPGEAEALTPPHLRPGPRPLQKSSTAVGIPLLRVQSITPSISRLRRSGVTAPSGDSPLSVAVYAEECATRSPCPSSDRGRWRVSQPAQLQRRSGWRPALGQIHHQIANRPNVARYR